MSTIARKFTRNGVATDMTSVALGASGIVRTDTGATLPGTGPTLGVNKAFDHVGTGLYSLDFTEPLPGLTYTYTINWVSPNGVPGARTITIGGSTSAGGSGWVGSYTSQAEIEGSEGADLVDMLSDTTGAGVPNPARFTYAGQTEEAEINVRADAEGFIVPIVQSSILADQWLMLKRIAITLVRTRLYLSPRGWMDKGTDQVGGQMANDRKEALDKLEWLLPLLNAPRKTGAASRGIISTVTVARRGCLPFTTGTGTGAAAAAQVVYSGVIEYIDSSLSPLDGQLVMP